MEAPSQHYAWLLNTAVGATITALTACGTADTDFPTRSRLPAPDDPTVQADGLSVTVSWSPVAGASSYLVYWAPDATVTTESGTQAKIPDPPYIHQASAFGVTYAYLVAAVDARGIPSRPSSVVTITPTGPAPAAPTNVRATAGDRQVTLEWDPVNGATGYEIEVSSQFGKFSVSDPVEPRFVHLSLLNCVPTQTRNCPGYQYRVRAKFGTRLGEWSFPVTAVPTPTTPGTPVFTDVRALVRTDADPIGTPYGATQLTWSSAALAREYQVYVTVDPNDPEQRLIDPDDFPLRDTTFEHRPVPFGVTYTYRIEAINDGVTSPPINPGSGSDTFLAPDRARARVPFPLTPGADYVYVARGFDDVGETPDVPVVSVERPEAPHSRDLSWSPPSGGGLLGQFLYRAASAPDPFELIAVFADLTASSHQDALVAPEPIPTGLAVVAQGRDLVVSWSPISDASGDYRLYWREQAPGGGGAMGSKALHTTEYRHEGLQSGSTYIYSVRMESGIRVSSSVSAIAP